MRAQLLRVAVDDYGVEGDRANHLCDTLPGCALGSGGRGKVCLKRLTYELRLRNGAFPSTLGECARQRPRQTKSDLVAFHAVNFNGSALH